MNLSTHLSLKEFVGKSGTLPTELLPAAVSLATNIFEPIRLHRGAPIRVNSGYRSPERNKAVGGTKNSQHVKAEALDLPLTKDEFLWIKDNLDFDQLIAEFPVNGKPSWVHVSYNVGGNQRKQVLIAVKLNGKTKYLNYKGNEKLIF